MGQSIIAQHVGFTFDSQGDPTPALANITFEIDRNEFVVILGSSGCGKTTLLRLLAGTITPSSGRLVIGNRPILGPDPRVAMVFQEFVLLPWKTVLENVALGLKVQEHMESDRRYAIARNWIRTVGLEDVADAYPSDLSGGMKQRVGLARAFAVDPDILLLDEPFGSLDAQTRDRMQLELLDLWNREKTVVFVTHDIDEAIFLADRVLVLSGRPATVRRPVRVEFSRPRSKRRLEIEGSERFSRLKRDLRAEIGLVPT